LLSTTRFITGTDVDGDRWSLRLIGPGAIQVLDKDGNPPDGANPFTIDTITIAATDLLKSHVIGKVQKAPTGDGRVYFRSMVGTGGYERLPLDPAEQAGKPPITNGIHVIDMPGFWIGDTDPDGAPLRPIDPNSTTAGTATDPNVVAGIIIPDGVNTLHIGGADTTYNGMNTNGKPERIEINLSVPATQGTSVVVDKFISSAEASATAGGASIQDSIYVNVEGRLNLFQANSIEGNKDPSLIPSQFTDGQADGNPGGVVVTSGTGHAPFDDRDAGAGTAQSGSLTGAIGNFRVGGNATNLSVVTYDATGSSSVQQAKVSNFFIGGETNNVLLLAPGGSRNVYFGLGMDTVTINSLFVAHLQANRGAVGSNVTVERNIDSAVFGGDVVDTNVLAGYTQNFGAMIQAVRLNGSSPETITNMSTLGQRYAFSPPFVPQAHNGGRLIARVAGDVTTSVFASSVQANPLFDKSVNAAVFGSPTSFNLPMGIVQAKVQGEINNSANALVDPDAMGQAFFGAHVKLSKGPVIPPNVPSEPFTPTHQVVPNVQKFTIPKHLQSKAYTNAPTPKPASISSRRKRRRDPCARNPSINEGQAPRLRGACPSFFRERSPGKTTPCRGLVGRLGRVVLR
jgi:hypothetical protein